MSTGGAGPVVTTQEIEVPDLHRLAKLYREAMANADASMAGACEGAAMQFAVAEGALAEAVALARFVDDASV